MKSKVINTKRFLLIILTLMITIATIFTFVQISYAEPTTLGPDHVLTYKFNDGKPTLRWDKDTDIKSNGAAYLSLFKNAYQNVIASNGNHVIAPGTDGQNIIRLSNEHDHSIKYTAVIYEVRSNENLPVVVNFADGSYTDTTEYKLPFNDQKYDVIRAVTGEVKPKDSQDFKIDWKWIFEIDDEGNKKDTLLGNNAAFGQPDDIQVGVYIVVEDETAPNKPIYPGSIKTGDDSQIVKYACQFLLCIIGVAIITFVETYNVKVKKTKN